MLEGLKEVTIETSSFCNQGCAYCPVTYYPRPKAVMPFALFCKIVDQIAQHRPECVSLHGYNEPSLQDNLSDEISYLKQKKLKVLISSNGSGLFPDYVSKLQDAGLDRIAVNPPSINRQYYRRIRKADDLPTLLENLRRLKNKRIFTDIIILGRLDEIHEKNAREIMGEFPWQNINLSPVIDRAGTIQGEYASNIRHHRISGCLEGKIRNSLYITFEGKVLICCQDYQEKYVIADLRVSSLKDILYSDRRREFLGKCNGAVDSGSDFICKRCSLSLPYGKSKKAYLKEIFCQTCQIDRELCRNCFVGYNLEGALNKIARFIRKKRAIAQ